MLFENVPNLELWGTEFVVPSANHLEKFITRPDSNTGSRPLRAQTAYPAVRPSNSFIVVSWDSVAYKQTENSVFDWKDLPAEIMVRPYIKKHA